MNQHWTVRLNDVAEINPKAPKGIGADTDVAFVPMAAVSEDGHLGEHVTRPYSEVSKGYSYFERGDLLLAKITPCFENGKAALVDNLAEQIGFGSTEFHVLRPGPDLDAKYLFYMLWNERFRAEASKAMTGSAGQKRVPADLLRRTELRLPPLDEQRRIAAILDKADALRQQRKRAFALLDSLTRSIFLEMFGDPESNPFGWPDVSFGDLILEGPTNGLYRPASDYGSGTPIVRIDAFYDGVITGLKSLKRLRLDAKTQSPFALRPGDVVINRVNSLEYLGKSALVPELSEPTVFESNMMRIRLDDGRVTPGFCVAFLQSDWIKKQILRSAKKAVNQASINQTDVKSFSMFLPPLEKQLQFDAAIVRLGHMKDQIPLRQVDHLFDSLQHRAFFGGL